MISKRGRAAVTRRVAVAVACGLVMAGTTVGAASAAVQETPPSEPQGGAVAVLDGLKVHDDAVIHEEGERIPTGAGLFEMAVTGGGSLQTYSVDVHSSSQEDAQYQETPWKHSSLHENPDAGKVRWILRNSYPQVNDLTALAKKAGAGKLSAQTAAAGTQVAIWRYSDNVKVTAVDKDAQKLADHLYRKAGKQADSRASEPRASLTVDPPAIAGKPGERLGPITVRTQAQRASVKLGAEARAEGVRVTDEEGAELRSVSSGDELYLDVPADAADVSTSLSVEAATTVPVGRVLSGFGEHAASQTQILAGSSESTVTATVDATFTTDGPAPAISAAKNCVEGQVDISVANGGDAPFAFSLGEQNHEVAPQGAESLAVPVEEDQEYRVVISGPRGFEQVFSGVLDCATKSSVPVEEEGLSVQTEPVTVGGSGEGPNLAETGNSSNVPLLIGIAVAMLVLGGVAVVMVQRNKPAPEDSEAPDGNAGDGNADATEEPEARGGSEDRAGDEARRPEGDTGAEESSVGTSEAKDEAKDDPKG